MVLYGDEEELVVGVSPFLKDWGFYKRIVKAFSVASFDLIGPALSQRLIVAVNSVSFFFKVIPCEMWRNFFAWNMQLQWRMFILLALSNATALQGSVCKSCTRISKSELGFCFLS